MVDKNKQSKNTSSEANHFIIYIILGIIALSLLIVLIATSVAKYLDTQNKVVWHYPNNDKLSTLNCGENSYPAEKKELNGVEIIETIEGVVNKVGADESVCNNIDLAYGGPYVENLVIGVWVGETEVENVWSVVLYDKNNVRETADPKHQSTQQFRFDFNERKIFRQQAFDGSFFLIGAF